MVMKKQRGLKTKQEIVNDIISIKKSDPDNKLSAESVRKILLKMHPGSKNIPQERAIYNIIRRNKDKIVFNPFDSQWSLGSDCEIPDNKVNEIMAIQAMLSEYDRYLTVRAVKWIIKLSPFIRPILENKYPGEKLDNELRLFEIASIYNRREQVSEINSEFQLNTYDLDKRFIIEQDLALESYIDEWKKVFITDTLEQSQHLKENEKLTDEDREKILKSFTPEQITLFYQWVNLILSHGDNNAFLKAHPEIKPLVNKWTVMNTRRGIARWFTYIKENNKDGE